MKMRVAIVVNRLDYGGTERIVDRLTRGINSRQVQVIPVVVRGPGQMGTALQNDGYAVHDLGVSGGLKRQPLRSLYAAMQLASFIRQQHIDLVHGFLFEGNLVARLAARRAQVPALSSFRGDHFALPFERWAEQSTRQLVQRYVAVSQATAQAASEALLLPQRRIEVIYNGISLPAALPEAQKIERLGFLGRLHPEKGVETLLRAFALLPQPRPRLRVAGDGPLESTLRQLSQQLGIAAQVDFLGRVKADARFWSSVDAQVIPSRFEGLSNVALEAMAYGRAVIASDAGGNRELVVNGETGFIVPRDDVKSLADAMQKIAHPGLVTKFGRAGRRRVQHKFTQNMMLQNYLNLWQQVAISGRAEAHTT